MAARGNIGTWLATGALLLWAHRPAAAGSNGAETHPGRAAAHAALSSTAGLPATPPSLPTLATGSPRETLEGTAFGKKGEAERDEHAQAAKHANDAASDARSDTALRAAQGAVAAAAKNANAESHAAAGQARANAAKANAAAHHGGGPPGKP